MVGKDVILVDHIVNQLPTCRIHNEYLPLKQFLEQRVDRSIAEESIRHHREYSFEWYSR
jgi:hypothetical protein